MRPVAAWRWSPLVGAAMVLGGATLAGAATVRSIDLDASDIAWDAVHDRLYASIPAHAADTPDSIAVIDPATGAVETTVFVGDDPGRLAVDPAGEFLYVIVRATQKVRRLQLPALTRDLDFASAPDHAGGPTSPLDVAVMPRDPHAVAVAAASSSFGSTGVGLYVDGFLRGQTIGAFMPANRVFFSDDGTFLFANQTSSFGIPFRARATIHGLLAAEALTDLGDTRDLAFAGGLLFSTAGRAVDPATQRIVGTFPVEQPGFVAPDAAAGRIHFLALPSSGPVLSSFDLATFRPLDVLPIDVDGPVTRLLRWGVDGLAFVTQPTVGAGHVVLVEPSGTTGDTVTTTTSTTSTTLAPPPGVAVRQLDLPARDLVWDPVRQRIHASVAGRDPVAGNSIVTIEPASGTIERAVFVGSEPDRLALDDAGRTLYATLGGATGVAALDLDTGAAAPVLALSDPVAGPLFADDLVVLPDGPESFVVSRHAATSAPVTLPSVAVWDDGRWRPAGASSIFGSGSGHVERGADAHTLYAYDGQDLLVFGVDSAGVAILDHVRQAITGPADTELSFADGVLYAATGRAVVPATRTLVGTFADAGAGPVAPDPGSDRVYFLRADTLLVFDGTTFVRLASIPIPGLPAPDQSGSFVHAGSLVRWGEHGLAFRTDDDRVFLVELPPEPIPATTTTTTTTPASSTTTTTLPPGVAIRHVRLPAHDLAWDEGRGVVYASIASSDPVLGNSVAALDPSTGAVARAVRVGSEPGRLALDDGADVLYVALDGAGAVARVRLSTFAVEGRFGVGFSDLDGPLFAHDLAVAPGQPDVVAVARGRLDANAAHEVAAYDWSTGTARPIGSASQYPAPSVDSIAFGTSPLRLYGQEGISTGFTFTQLDVDQEGVHIAQQARELMAGFDTRIVFAGGLVYGSRGRAVDPEALRIVGTFPGVEEATGVAPDPAAGRVTFLDAGALRIFDARRFVPRRTVVVPGVAGPTASLVRCGTDGFAFRSAPDDVFLVRVTEPVPATTTTSTLPPPTTSTSTPATSSTTTTLPLVARTLALPTNDLVADPTRALLYASVPSYDPAFGNDVVAIDPASGTVAPVAFAGSEPGPLALDDAATTLWVGLGGAPAITRVALATADVAEISLGNDPYQGPLFATSLAVMPGHPDVLAVVRLNGGIAVYDHGAARAAVTPTYVSARRIAFDEEGDRLYGVLGTNLIRMDVNDDGVSAVPDLRSFPAGPDFALQNGRIYDTGGRVVLPDLPALAGTFTGIKPPFGNPNVAVAPDVARGRVYFVSQGRLLVFDPTTYLRLAAFDLPGDTSNATSLVRWGDDGLAYRSGDGRVVLLRVPPLFPPVTPPPVPPTSAHEHVLGLATRDLVHDARRDEIVASVASSDPVLGNAVAGIDPARATVAWSVPVGSEPGRLALDDTGNTLYVALDGAGALRRVDLATRTAAEQFPLGWDFYGPLGAVDLAVMPGHPETVAVLRRSASGSQFDYDVAIFVDGVELPSTSRDLGFPFDQYFGAIAFADDPPRLFAVGSRGGLYRLTIGDTGITARTTMPGTIDGAAPRIEFVAGAFYASDGTVRSPDLGTLLGTYPVATSIGIGPNLLDVDPVAGRVHFLGVSLVTFDQHDFTALATRLLPGIAGGPSSLVHWGDDGVAFRTDADQLFLLRTTVSSGASSTTTTSTTTSTLTAVTSTVTTLQPEQPISVAAAPMPGRRHGISVTCRLAGGHGRCEVVARANGIAVTRRVQRRIGARGEVRLGLALNRAGRRQLRKTGSLDVDVEATVTRAAGGATTVVTHVTVHGGGDRR